MPYIMNALPTTVSTQAHGKWFTFRPGEIKTIHNNALCQFLYQYRGEEGLVEVPDHVMELDKSSAEYKRCIEDKRQEGITKRVQKLDSIKRNLLGSLRFDIESAGMKVDPLTFASKGELAAIKELTTLQATQVSATQSTADEIRRLLEGTPNGSSDSSNIGETNTRSSNTVKPAQSGKQ